MRRSSPLFKLTALALIFSMVHFPAFALETEQVSFGNGGTWTGSYYIDLDSSNRIIFKDADFTSETTLASFAVLAQNETVSGLWNFSGSAPTIGGTAILTASTGQPLDADLTALAALAATGGMLSRTGAGAFAVRTLTGGSQISITNGDGVSGAPTFGITADSIGPTQLLWDMDQHLLTTSDPTFDDPIVDDLRGDRIALGSTYFDEPILGGDVPVLNIIDTTNDDLVGHAINLINAGDAITNYSLLGFYRSGGTFASKTATPAPSNTGILGVTSYWAWDGAAWIEAAHSGVTVETAGSSGDYRARWAVGQRTGSGFANFWNSFEIDDTRIAMFHANSTMSESDFASLDGAGDLGVGEDLQVKDDIFGNDDMTLTGELTANGTGTHQFLGLLRVDNGTLGTNGTATGAGDAYIEDALEVDGASALNTLTVGSTATITGNLAHSAEIIHSISTPATISASQNNYDLGTATIVRVSADDVGYSITGFVAPSPEAPVEKILINISDEEISIPNGSGSSSEANRVLTPNEATYTLGGAQAAGYCVRMIYDTVSDRWRIVSNN